jgi:hypothetical protein
MGSRVKTITPQCENCTCMKVNDNNDMTCVWGKGKPKILRAQKGKQLLKCKLTKD